MNTTTSTTDTPTPSLSDTFRSTRRKPRGKIAELPKTIRDLVNQLLDDGATYRTIRIELAKHGLKLNGENISNWFDSGYQIHVEHKLWLQNILAIRESAPDLLEDYNAINLHQAANQLATIQIFQALKSQKFNDNPLSYTRILNALARLGRDAIALTKSREEMDAEPMFNIPDDEELKRRPLAQLGTLLAAMKPALNHKPHHQNSAIEPLESSTNKVAD